MYMNFFSTAKLHYTISPEPNKHLFRVHLRIAGSHLAGVRLFLPNWIAGSYMIRDFARHITQISAFDDSGKAIKLTPVNQFTWQSAAFEHNLHVVYDVFAHDPSVRTAFLNGDTGFFNATSVCLSIAQHAEKPHALTILAPHTNHEPWQIATQLTRAEHTEPRAFGDYWAKNYDELADRPVRMGPMRFLDFEAMGTAHSIAISGAFDSLNADQLIQDVRKICAEQIRMFATDDGAPPVAPFDSYLFLLDVRGAAYGGLEHRDSTALLCSRDSLPNHLDAPQSRRPEYIELLGLISHEYFHSWNVKRIKPASFVRYDLQAPIDTSLLWFFEGVTNYYDDLFLFRTGILTEPAYIDVMNRNVNHVLRHRAQHLQNASDAGFYAWTKYYQPSENSINANTNYYVKGSLIAWCIDLFIRHNSHQRYGLDDVMRRLWQDFGRDFYTSEQPRGVTLADIQICIEHFAGVPARDLLYIALFTTQSLPLNLLLLTQGLHLKYHAPKQPQLGVSSKKTSDGWLIERVLSDGLAERAGLAPQDTLIAVNQLRLKRAPDEALKNHPQNSRIALTFWRDDVLKSTSITQRIPSTQIGEFKIEPSPKAFQTTAWPRANAHRDILKF